MTQDEIIEMAQECGLIGMRPHLDGIYAESLVAFAALVAAKAIEELESQKPLGYITIEREVLERALKALWLTANPESEKAIFDIQQALAHPPQRTWVGLTKEDMPDGENPMFDHKYFIAGMVFAANILEEKNT